LLPPYPTLYEINTWVWLSELSKKAGCQIDLGSVPSTEWDAIAALGFDAVWLMGADNLAQFNRWDRWETIAASIPIAVFNRPGWAFRALSSPAAHALAEARIAEKAAARTARTAPPAWVFITRPQIDLSSTALRSRHGRAKSAS